MLLKIMKQYSCWSQKNIPIFNFITLTVHKRDSQKQNFQCRLYLLHQTFTVHDSRKLNKESQMFMGNNELLENAK
jgi:hypothetical protein